MAQHTEVTRDIDGNVVDRRTVIDRPDRPGFGWGMLIGVVIIALALVAFAYSQGSFQRAGRQADRAAETAQTQVDRTTDDARQSIHEATAPNGAADDSSVPPANRSDDGGSDDGSRSTTPSQEP